MNTMLLAIAARRAEIFGGGYMITYLLCIAAMILAMIASAGVKLTFKKYAGTSNIRGITAAEAAREILDANGLTFVTIMHVGGNLTDHYDLRTNVVSLSDSVYSSTSLSAIAVAAHECGHAIQHDKGYLPIKIRTAIVPVVNLSSRLYLYVFLAGILFSLPFLVNIGIVLFFAVVLFQLVTLPVEFNASIRALRTLEDMNILVRDELPAARKTLFAAAMTYVAALAVALTQLLRLVSRSKRR